MPQPPPRVTYCLSYTPLPRGEPGVDLADEVRRHPDRLRQFLAHAVSGLATACLWVMRAGQLVPVLVYDRGSEIHGHLLEWAENDPAGWFTLFFSELPDDPEEPPGYAVVLQPRLDRSVERFKRSFPSGMLEGVAVEAVFSPLYFVGSGTSYLTLKDRIGPTSGVGILDAAHFDPQKPGDFDPQRVRFLGPFAVGDMADLGGVDAFLRSAARLPH